MQANCQGPMVSNHYPLQFRADEESVVATSALELGGLSWKELGRRVVRGIAEDDVSGRAAELAYYFFLALFPLLICVAAVLGIVAGPGSELRSHLLQYLTQAMPSSAGGLVQRTFDQTTQ